MKTDFQAQSAGGFSGRHTEACSRVAADENAGMREHLGIVHDRKNKVPEVLENEFKERMRKHQPRKQ